MIFLSKDLPISAFQSGAHIELNSNREAVIEGIKGIIEYSDLYIKLSLPKGTLELFGSDLEIVTLSAGGVIIGGLIYKLEFDI